VNDHATIVKISNSAYHFCITGPFSAISRVVKCCGSIHSPHTSAVIADRRSLWVAQINILSLVGANDVEKSRCTGWRDWLKWRHQRLKCNYTFVQEVVDVCGAVVMDDRQRHGPSDAKKIDSWVMR